MARITVTVDVELVESERPSASPAVETRSSTSLQAAARRVISPLPASRAAP